MSETVSTTTSAPGHHAPPTPLWRNFSFTLMWTSTAASGFGDRMIMLAALALLGGLAAEGDSTSTQAGTQFFFFMPYLFFSVLGGWVADRLPRKWLLMACDEARGLLLLLGVFLIGGASQVDPDREWQVYAMLFAIGIFASIFNPTRNAIVPQLVERQQMQPANAVVLVINVVFSMIGMVVGGRIISPDEASSVETGLLVGALFYLISGSFFAFMRPKSTRLLDSDEGNDNSRTAVSLIDAMKYVACHRKVIWLIVIDVMVWGAAATMYSGVIGLCKIHYSLTGDALMKEFTQVSAALGFGMLAGAVVIGLIRTRQQAPLVMGVALAIAGLNVLLVSVIPLKAVTYVGAFFVGVAGNVAIVSVISLLQSIAPNSVRGSVMGLAAMVTTVVSVIIYGMIWQLEDADTKIIYVLYGLGPLLIVAGLGYALYYLTHGPMPAAGGNFFRHLVRFFCLVWHRLEWDGRHHIPESGPVILAANHTTALDPFLMQAACPRQIRWLMLTSYRFKAVEFFWKIIDPIFIDHDESGERVNASKQVRQIVKHLKAGDCLGIFPEGNLQYDDRILKPFEDGVAVTARLSKAQIVPVWIEGTEVSKSMARHFLTPGRRRIAFGPPFTPDRAALPEEITAELRRRMIALASGPVEEAPAASDE
ncbi:MFS transporter [Algisphaera agarilytica]|uniref:1-acyl-sn-glycerol-3-phosphate acyltransferase n=1 Tax=Algisphaera agarilytica TaxID=1385975 RepID=A0A7X0H9C7_9BACT|nr:MFS transporter [Algisphaera agarilytica]MBB6431682.1 1-acyl-sn-glycerol-3-phosphate acyltransferase [Algisphaera agarilytica]